MHFKVLMCSEPWLCVEGQLIMFVFNLLVEGFSANPNPNTDPNPIPNLNP